MKIKHVSLLLTLPFLILTGCGDETSIRPEDSDDTKTTNPTIPDSSTISGGSIVAGIKTEELMETIEEVKGNFSTISTKSSTSVIEAYDYNGDLASTPTVKKNTMNATDRYYEGNSVRVVTNTAASADDFKAFNLWDETLGNLINGYTFVNFDTNKIETRGVYSKEGEAALNVKKVSEMDWTLANYDINFNVASEAIYIDVVVTNVSIAGKLSTGETYIKGTISHDETLNETYGLTQVTESFMEIYMLNDNLTRLSVLTTTYLVDAESVEYNLNVASSSINYQTTKNGNFDREGSLPVITVEE